MAISPWELPLIVHNHGIEVPLCAIIMSNQMEVMIGQKGTAFPMMFIWYGTDGVQRLHIATKKNPQIDTAVGGINQADTYDVLGREIIYIAKDGGYTDASNAEYAISRPMSLTIRYWKRLQ